MGAIRKYTRMYKPQRLSIPFDRAFLDITFDAWPWCSKMRHTYTPVWRSTATFILRRICYARLLTNTIFIRVQFVVPFRLPVLVETGQDWTYVGWSKTSEAQLKSSVVTSNLEAFPQMVMCWGPIWDTAVCGPMFCGPFSEKLRCTLAQQDAKKTSSAARRLAEKDSHTHLLSMFPPHLRRILEASSEKGSGSWLTALPLTSHGFALHKGDSRDAFCLRFSWQPSSLPLVCICGKPFAVEHALSCSCGGYPSIRHNELRDITATLLTEVSNNVGIEPVLQKLSGEHLTQKNIYLIWWCSSWHRCWEFLGA